LTKEGESGKAEDENDEYDAGLMDKPETEPESVTSAGIGRPYGSAGMVSRTVERSARIASRSVSRAKRKATGVAVPPVGSFLKVAGCASVTCPFRRFAPYRIIPN